MEKHPGLKKPYKVCKVDRRDMKGITASHLNELIDTAKQKLCLLPNEALTLVLEKDGTEVDDEEYFNTLPEGTEFILLHGGQVWMPSIQKSAEIVRERLPELSKQELYNLAECYLDLLTTFS